jgi:hypothetical protein
VGSGNLHNIAGAIHGTGTEVFIVRCGQVSPRFRGQGLDACASSVDTLAAGRAASLLARPLLRCRAPRAFSSVGESARLITVRSLVRIQKGPRLPHLDGRPLLMGA